MEQLSLGLRIRLQLNQIPLAWSLGIAISGSDHTRAARPGNREIRGKIQTAECTGLENRREFRTHQGHQGLAFRVTEATVELDHLGACSGEHQAGIDHSPVLDALVPQGLQSGFQHKLTHLFEPGLIEQGSRGIGTHSAGVRSPVALQ